MIVGGLDMSLSSTGWCVLRADGTVDTIGVIKTAPVEDPHDRIGRYLSIVHQVLEVLDGVDHTGIEGYAFAKHTSGIWAGELGGILRLGLQRRKIPWSEFALGTWCKEVLGKGSIQKDARRTEIFKRYGVEHQSLDAVEAFGVARCTWQRQTGEGMPTMRRGAAA